MPVASCARGALLVLFLASPITTRAQSADSLLRAAEGRWYGVAGFPEDRVEMGFEIRRNAAGEVKLYLYNPVINFYGLEIPRALRVENGRLINDGNFLSVALEGDRLIGTYYPLRAPIDLRRVKELPREQPVPKLSRGPEPRWRTRLGGSIYGAAALKTGIAYVGTTAGYLHAVRIADGTIAWSFSAGGPIFGEALATNDAIFFVCDNGYLFKLERETGKEVWQYDLGDARTPRALVHADIKSFDMDVEAPRPVIADGVIYVGGGDGGFHAVDASSGQRVWRFAAKGKIRTTAVVDGPRVVFASWDDFVYALAREDGRELWKKQTGGEGTSAPAIAGPNLIIANRSGLLAAIGRDSATTAWRVLFWGSSVESDPVVLDSTIDIGSSDLRRISSIDARTARVWWRTDIYGWAWARPLVTDSVVYAGAMGVEPYQMRHLGGLSAIDRRTGRTLWRWAMPEWPGSLINGFAAGPAIEGNVLVVGGVDGALYAFPAR